ncbi:MAG: glutathione S-transferase domain-containing protein, partial [Gammaproteobacteria bacterium]
QFDTDALGPHLAAYRSQLDAHTAFVEAQLADGRAFLLGERPGWVDLHAMWDPWFLYRFAPTEAERAYGRFPRIAAWLDRLAAIGHGTRSEMPAAAALDIARNATPLPPTGIAAGTHVRVAPADYAEAEVEGELVGTTISSLTIRRQDARVGTVCVHFPKIGYSVVPV